MSMPVAVSGVGRMRPGDHLCLVHETPEERESVLADFIADGLMDRQKVLLLSAEGTLGDLSGLLTAVGARGLDPGAYLDSGVLAVRPAADAARAVEAALLSGAPAVRLCRDAPRSLAADELRATEERLAAAVASQPVLALCAYNAVAFTQSEIQEAIRDHGGGLVELDPLYEDGLLRVVRRFTPPALRAEGDIDASNVVHLARVLGAECVRLRRRPATGPGGQPEALRLEAGRLDFIDVTGMRLLVQTASRLHAEGGRRLVLVGLAPHLRRVMRVVGWDLTPGLVIVDERGGERGDQYGGALPTCGPGPPAAPALPSPAR